MFSITFKITSSPHKPVPYENYICSDTLTKALKPFYWSVSMGDGICVMRCWSTWVITLYDRLRALNLRNVNKPAARPVCLSSEPRPECQCQNKLCGPPSPSLSPHPTIGPVLQQTVSRTIHERPAAAMNNSRSLVHLSTKARQTDGWTQKKKKKRWMESYHIRSHSQIPLAYVSLASKTRAQ